MKNLIIPASLLMLAFGAKAQRLHVNLFTGISNYAGDLQAKTFTLDQAHFAAGIGFSYDLSSHFAIRTGVTIGKLSANDKYGKNKDRNLNFSSGLTEGNLGLEYYITPVGIHSLTPYLFAGAAIYHYNPYTYDQAGRKYNLQPLSTEGQGFVTGRDPYKLTQLAIPFGGGVKLSLSDNINAGWELGIRKLSTDYLDDVSKDYIDRNILLAQRGAKAVELAYRGDEVKGGIQQYPAIGKKRGNPGQKDWYYFTGFTISFRLGGLGRYSEYGCPRSVL